MSSYADFNKKASDLVNKEFPADDLSKRETRRFEYKAKSLGGTDVAFNAFQRLQDPQFDAVLSLKKKCPSTEVLHEAEIKADTFKVSLTSDGKIQKDLKTVLVVDVDPQTIGKDAIKYGGSLEVAYNHENKASVSAKVEQKKDKGTRDLTIGVVYNHGAISVGGQAKLDNKPEKLEAFPELGFAVQHKTADLIVGASVLNTRNKVDAATRDTKVSVSAWQQFNASVQFGALAEVPLGQTGTPKISAAVQKNLSNGELVKLRLVVPDGRVGAFYAAKLGANSTLSLSSDLNVLKVREGVDDNTLAFGVKLAVSSE